MLFLKSVKGDIPYARLYILRDSAQADAKRYRL